MKFALNSLRNVLLKPRFAALRETLLGIFVALFVSTLLTFVAHVCICLGFHPETIFAVDWLAPLLGTFCGAWFSAQQSSKETSSWRSGFLVAFSLIALWFVVWSYLVARFNFAAWPRQVFQELGFAHFLSWSLALLFGVAGAIVGDKTRRYQKCSKFVLTFCVLALLPLVMQISHWLHRDVQPTISSETVLSKGVLLHTSPPTKDGTTVRLLTFDLSQQPNLTFAIYDADSDDAIPFDNRNTSWLGQSLQRVLDKAQNRVGEKNDVLCLVNGGFFGAENQWTARHEAPIVVDGKPLYNSRTLEHDWPQQNGSLAISRLNGQVRFGFLRDVAWKKLRDYQTVLGGVRGLIFDNKLESLKPGMGGTLLKCSRTSVAWSNDSRFFYVLSVRDMDGEAASLRQRAAQKLGVGTPGGGWDVSQVQQFWQKIKVPNAVLFDGGESTQLVYRKRNVQNVFVSSAYQLSHTFGYWRERPLRAYLPLLPPAPNRGGVLNYLYIAAPLLPQR